MKGVSKIRKLLSLIMAFTFIFQQAGFAQVATELNIANHLARMASSFTVEKFRPLHLRYFFYDALSDNFKVLLDKGDEYKGLSPKGAVPEQKLQEDTKTLLSYFLIGVTLPDSMFWVNLRPDSEDQIIDPYLEKTDVGKIMLEADLQLKKDTALYTSPQTPEGKEYWNRLYKKAAEIFSNENIEIPTLTRPWIVPGEIIVRESKDSAYVYKANLKVMLEQDYLKDSTTYNFKDERSKALNEYSSQLIRELIIPKLTKEVNSSKRYAPLRQVYYSLILSRWFKLRFTGKAGTYAALINTRNLTNLISQEDWSKTEYFKQYQKSFSQGEYNIKEPVYTPTGQVIRSYFSGGIQMSSSAITGNGFSIQTDHLSRLPGTLMGGRASNPPSISLQPPVAASSPLTVDSLKGQLRELDSSIYLVLDKLAKEKQNRINALEQTAGANFRENTIDGVKARQTYDVKLEKLNQEFAEKESELIEGMHAEHRALEGKIKALERIAELKRLIRGYDSMIVNWDGELFGPQRNKLSEDKLRVLEGAIARNQLIIAGLNAELQQLQKGISSEQDPSAASPIKASNDKSASSGARKEESLKFAKSLKELLDTKKVSEMLIDYNAFLVYFVEQGMMLMEDWINDNNNNSESEVTVSRDANAGKILIKIKASAASSPLTASDIAIAGNWKLRPFKDEEAARAKAGEFKTGLADIGKKAEIVLFVEDKWMEPISKELERSNISVGAQSFHFDPAGTGNLVVIKQQIDEAVGNGAKYAMVGHSMHRKPTPEVLQALPGLVPLSNVLANQIVKAILADGRLKLWYVIAVDEHEGIPFSEQEDYIRGQIYSAINIGLDGVSVEQLSKIKITVEPMVDISTPAGTGVIDPKTKVNFPKVEMLAKHLAEAISNKFGKTVEVNTGYGATVRPDTSGTLLSHEHIFNLLPGGMSLEVENFRATIINGIRGKADSLLSATVHQIMTDTELTAQLKDDKGITLTSKQRQVIENSYIGQLEQALNQLQDGLRVHRGKLADFGDDLKSDAVLAKGNLLVVLLRETIAKKLEEEGIVASSPLGIDLKEQPDSYMYVGEPITPGVMPEVVTNYYGDPDLLWVIRKGNTDDIRTVTLDSKTAAAVKFGTSGDRGTFDDSNPDKRFNIQRTLRVAQGIADYYHTQGLKGAVPVGYDNRALSREYAYLITAVLTANDIVVELTDTATPVPVVAFAVAASQETQKPMAGGIVVTASHNPWEYNGIKWMLPNGGAAMSSVTDLIEKNAKQAVQAKIMPIAVALQRNLVTMVDLKQGYINYIIGKLPDNAKEIIKKWGSNARNAVMINPMQGASIGYLSAIVKELGIKDIREVNTKVDRMFTEVKNTPNPDSALDFDLDIAESHASMNNVVELLADGDADRFGVRDVTGEKFTANELIPLFKAFLREKGYKGAIAKTLVTSDLSNAVDEADGETTLETDTGFKYLVDALESGRYLAVGEESAHVGLHLFKESKDDGIAVGLMALWIIAEKGSLTNYMKEVETKIGRDFRYRRIDTAYSEKKGLVEKGQEMVRLINLPEAAKIVQDNGGKYDFDYASNVEKFRNLEIIVQRILPVAQDNGGIAKVFICYDPLSKKSSGYKIVFANKSWVAIRVSGTGEPVIRLYVEAVSDLGKDNRTWVKVRQDSVSTWQKLAESTRDAIGLIKTSERLGTASFNIKGYYPTRRSIDVNIRIDRLTVSIYRPKPKGITTLELFKKEVLINELREKYGNDIDFVFSDYTDGLAVYDVVRSASSPISSDEDYPEAIPAAQAQQGLALAASSAVTEQTVRYNGMRALFNLKPWRGKQNWHSADKDNNSYHYVSQLTSSFWMNFLRSGEWEINLSHKDLQQSIGIIYSDKELILRFKGANSKLSTFLNDPLVTVDLGTDGNVEIITFGFSDEVITAFHKLGLVDLYLSDTSNNQLHWRITSVTQLAEEKKTRRESGSAASGADAARLVVQEEKFPGIEEMTGLEFLQYMTREFQDLLAHPSTYRLLSTMDFNTVLEALYGAVYNRILLPGVSNPRLHALLDLIRKEQAKRREVSNDSRSAGSPLVKETDVPIGGIDFRALPMTIQPMGSFQGLNFKLPQLSQAELEKINVAVEIQQIKNMVQAGIIPSGQRIKELIAACVQKDQINSHIDNLLLCLAETFKLEEENASESSPELREALVIVDSQS